MAFERKGKKRGEYCTRRERWAEAFGLDMAVSRGTSAAVGTRLLRPPRQPAGIGAGAASRRASEPLNQLTELNVDATDASTSEVRQSASVPTRRPPRAKPDMELSKPRPPLHATAGSGRGAASAPVL